MCFQLSKWEDCVYNFITNLEDFFEALIYWEAYCGIDLKSGRIMFPTLSPTEGIFMALQRKAFKVGGILFQAWISCEAFCGIDLPSGRIMFTTFHLLRGLSFQRNAFQVGEFCFKLKFPGRPFVVLTKQVATYSFNHKFWKVESVTASATGKILFFSNSCKVGGLYSLG